MYSSQFIGSIPAVLYCGQRPSDGIWKARRDPAILLPHPQPNAPTLKRWMVFDLDHTASYFQPEERHFLEPNFIAVNRKNGHAHVGYCLADPVSAGAKSSDKALSFFQDVERGIRKRLGGDPSYQGFLCKNPCHTNWEVDWQAVRPYDLHRLNDCLDKKDKIKPRKGHECDGFGRNCTLFNDLRKISYSEALKFKKDNRTFAEFAQFVEGASLALNLQFPVPLHVAEAKGVARSVAKWIWPRFDVEKFSRKQSLRVSKRWEKVQTLVQQKPWEADGVSRATWYRRRG